MSKASTTLATLLHQQAQVDCLIRQHRVMVVRSRVNKVKPKYVGKAKPLIDEMDRRLLKVLYNHAEFDSLLDDIEDLLE